MPGYAVAGSQSAPGEKIALYIDDGCDAAVLNAAFAPALNSHTRESFFRASQRRSVKEATSEQLSVLVWLSG